MARFTLPDYFTELVDFARVRVRFSADPPADIAEVAEELEGALLQRFEQLLDADNGAVAERPVQQTRIAVEILRRYLEPLPVDTADTDLRYVQSAYRGLLTALGTSFEELRIVGAGNGDPEVEEARLRLAGRLGLDTPERVDALTLGPTEVTEQLLEHLFGLAPTSGNPFTEQPSQPLVLTWRMDFLRTFWRDRPVAGDADDPAPVIDPDLIDEEMVIDPDHQDPSAIVDSNLIDEAARQAAPRLWRERAQEVAELVATVGTAIDEAMNTQPTPLAAFDEVVGAFLGQVSLETALESRTQSIPDPHEDENRPLEILDLSSLRRLVRLRMLAAAGSITDQERADLVGILTYVEKRERYASWRDGESEAGVFLSPDFFVLPDRARVRSLPAWRATQKQRRRWVDQLRSRLEQTQTMIEAARGSVDATEKRVLIELRDALVAAVAKHLGGRDVEELAEQLTRRLLVDFNNRAPQTTSRLAQAIETVRGLFFTLRTGSSLGEDLPGANPVDDWALRFGTAPGDVKSEVEFDLEWHWMGSYATRRGVEFVKEYPESYLLPSLRDRDREPLFRPTASFARLIDSLRTRSQLTRTQARQMANLGLGEPGPDNPNTGYLFNLRAELQQAEPDVAKLPPELDDFELREQLSPEDVKLGELERALLANFDLTRTLELPGGNQEIEDPHLAPHWFQELFYFVPMAVGLQLHRSGEYLAALDWFQTVYAYQLPVGQRKVYPGLDLERVFPDRPRITPTIWLREELNPHFFARERRHAYTRFTIASIAQCLLDFADAEFTLATEGSLARARTLYLTAQDLLGAPEMPAGNPIVDALRGHGQLNLHKLRTGRNIAGMERPARGASSDAAVPVIGAGGQLVVPRPSLAEPTVYRYQTLIERAKELVGIAQHLEASYLSALEKLDVEAYNLLRADQDLALSDATIDLQGLRVEEAGQQIALADLQRERVLIQSDTYQEWINSGLNRWEQAMIDSFSEAEAARKLANIYGTLGQIGQAFVTAATAVGPGAGVAAAAAGGVALAGVAQAGATADVIAAETAGQIAGVRASQERRQQEWQLQKSLADKDLEVADHQFSMAEQHKQIREEEYQIAVLQADHARAAVDFLANKFTNADLYQWMSRVLASIYSYFLQQATAMAQLAENQLGFERQETPPAFIQADYWQPPQSGETSSTADGAADRRGLTGSARLLQDLYRLDQYAFETNQRKLQLSQTLSLAQLFPLEFQMFRETGVLPFATPMELFDRGFPGHYLRLIQRVRTSIVALIPPTEGVRATLTTSGVSRVVTGGDIFQTTEVRRSPELIAFTSPTNATGVLELEPTEGMRLPFEGMGVDTHWELRMPKAANQFNYNTIADVLVTIEYTALDSYQYRRQVTERLGRDLSVERSYSIRDEFPDAWYDLHHPSPGSDAPLAVRFQTRRSDFPPNVEELRIAHLLVYFARTEPDSREIEIAALKLIRRLGEPVAGAGATTTDGVTSTRRANGAGWLPLTGVAPIGEWELVLSEDMRHRFANGEIDDMLFAITYHGRLPEWPS